MAYYDNAPAPVYASPVRSQLDAEKVRAIIAQAKAQTAGQGIENRINTQSADYYDATGESQASQKDASIGVDQTQANAQMMNAVTALAKHRESLASGGSEDNKRAYDMTLGINAMANNAREAGTPEEDVNAIYQDSMKASGLWEHVKGTKLENFNPSTAKAMASVLQNEGDYKQGTYRTSKGKFIPVNLNNVEDVNRMIKDNPNGSFINAGAGLTGKDFNPEQDEVTQRDLMQSKVTVKQIIGSVSELIPMAEKLKGFQSGNTGAALRGVGSAVSAVTDLVKEAGGRVKVGNKFVEDADFLQEYLGQFTGDSAEFKRNMARLGYLDARLQTGQTGRDLSNKDLENAMIGLDTSDKTQQVSILNSIGRNAQRMIRAKLSEVQKVKESEVEIPPDLQDYMDKDFSGKGASAEAGAFDDAEKEARYQAYKANKGK